MKPVEFSVSRPATVAEAVRLLKDNSGAKIVAGGQSLGPMLNLRLAQPNQLIDITAIAELTRFRDEPDAIVYGACITHASFEDRRLPDAANGFLGSVAGGIAYRAVRNRGTIGGSLVHADPAADWMTTLTALGAELIVATDKGARRTELAGFMTTPFGVALDDAEFLVGIRIRKFSPKARFGYFKFCRKVGEFAEAMAAVVVDPELRICRGVIGATDSSPVIVGDINAFMPAAPTRAAVEEALERGREHVAGLRITNDPIKNAMHGNAFARALRQVMQ
jgi:carbon-monoxide dehydrogenase medium subunit